MCKSPSVLLEHSRYSACWWQWPWDRLRRSKIGNKIHHTRHWESPVIAQLTCLITCLCPQLSVSTSVFCLSLQHSHSHTSPPGCKLKRQLLGAEMGRASPQEAPILLPLLFHKYFGCRMYIGSNAEDEHPARSAGDPKWGGEHIQINSPSQSDLM